MQLSSNAAPTERLVLCALSPRDDVYFGAQVELYVFYTSTTDDKLQSVVVFTVQVFLVVVVAFLIVAAAGKDIGQVNAKDNLACVLLADEQ